MFDFGGVPMSFSHGSAMFRAISVVCAMALVVASCGGADSSSNRNGRLNSALCFDTQEEKDAAIADAQRELDPVSAPIFEETAPRNDGGGVTLAFVGPQLWWLHNAASVESTTTTTQPATTTSSTDSTDVSTDSTDVSTETPVPLEGEMLLQQLRENLDAATNAPLCSQIEAMGGAEVAECNATAGFDLNNGSAYVDPCAEATSVRFTFDSPENFQPIDVIVAGGSRAIVASAGEGIGFTFEVFVGAQTAVAEFMYYPFDAPQVATEVECPVDVSLTPSEQGWLALAEACDAATHWELSLTTELTTYALGRYVPNFLGIFSMEFPDNVIRVTFSIYVGETQIAQGYLSPGLRNVYQGSGTYQMTSFGVTESSYSGGFVVDGNTDGDFEISDGEVLCSATVRNGLVSFDCAQPLTTQFAWGNTSFGGGLLYGDESTEYQIPGDLDSARIFVYGSEGLLLDEFFYDSTWSATYEFVVQDTSQSGLLDEEEYPFFSGTINPEVGFNSLVSFTIPEDYSSNYFFLQLYVECEDQTFEAMLYKDGQAVAAFVDMVPYRVLIEGLCGVWLIVEDFSGELSLGETFEVVITTSTGTRIMWDGSVPLEGFGVSREDDFNEETDDFEWEETISGEITADAIYSISIPAGGRRFEARGITNVFDGVSFEEPFVDPLLVLYNANGEIVADNDDGGEEYGYGELSSRLSLFLAEGFYTLRATTFNIIRDRADENALSAYELLFRIGAARVDTVKNDGSNEVVDDVLLPADLPPQLAVQVVELNEAPANLEPPRQPIALPIDQLVNSSRKDSDPLPVIPAGVTEVVCDSDCLSVIREVAGVGVTTIQIGSELVKIQPSARKATIPVRPSAKNIVITVTPTDGGEAVVLSTEVLVVSPLTFPTKFADGAKSVMKTSPSNGGISTMTVMLFVLALSLVSVVGYIRFRKIRLTE